MPFCRTPSAAIEHGSKLRPATDDVASRDWRPEQMWLWPDPSSDLVRTQLRAALGGAVAALPAPDLEHIAYFADHGKPGAALRLTARLLHVQVDDPELARDLTACALLLAAIEHRDERAVFEFAAFAHSRTPLAEQAFEDYHYPPPLDQPRRLSARLRHQASLVLSRARTPRGWTTVVRDLARLLEGDPLANLDGQGRARRGWDL